MKTTFIPPIERYYEDIDDALYAAKEFIRDGFIVEIKTLYSPSATENDDHAGVLLVARENMNAPSSKG